MEDIVLWQASFVDYIDEYSSEVRAQFCNLFHVLF